MPHVALISDTVATDEQRAVLAETAVTRGAIPNLYRAMAHSPEGARRVAALAVYLRYQSVLPARLRELTILAIAGRWRCAYERTHHEPIARTLGVDDATLTSLARGDVPPGLDPVEHTAIRLVHTLVAGGQPAVEDVSRLRDALGEQGLVELHLVAGCYTMLALFLNGLAVENEAVDGTTRA